MKKFTLFLSAMLFGMMSFAATVTFNPGDFEAVTDAAFEIEADGVTLSVSKGTITADQFRFFKSQTLTVSSTAGNITSIEITCTAAGDAKYGPGSFGALDGYTYAEKVGTWTGSASSVTFSTTNNQVRATQVVVTIDGEGGGNQGGDDNGNEGGDDNGNEGGDDNGNQGGEGGATAGSVTFDADVDKGNASEDSANQTAYTVSKGGVTLDVTKGIIGKFGEECHYRVYKGETLTITSTVGNITSIELTCTANDDEKYGPGCFTVDGGNYTYSGPVGTWTGSASSVVFTAATNQVRASQIVVTIDGEGGGNQGGDATVVELGELVYGDAYYYEEDGFYEIMLYNMNEAGDDVEFPLVMFGIFANSKTALNGTYDVLAALYATGWEETDMVYSSEDNVSTLVIKNVDNEGNYSFVGSFVGEDGKTYKVNTVSNIMAFDDATEEEIVLDEGGNTSVENVITVDVAEKVVRNGQVMIIRGENVYNATGVQVK